ncbi:MAG TPA: J domain-containing protein [Kofleriaceae bacterium]|nr:J domain-containing protein [Kofleriaceae bacterium]
MSAVPAEIAGIGSTQQKLRVSPSFDPLKAAVGPQEYFVLSRIDGLQTLREVLLTTGLPVDRAISIVQRLRAIGALLIPGETAAPAPAPTSATPRSQPEAGPRPRDRSAPLATAPARATPATSPQARTTGPIPVTRTGPTAGAPGAPLRRAASNQPAAPAPSEREPEHDLSLPNATPAELAALSEDIALDETGRRRILAMARLADGRDPWALIGLPVGSDARELKRAYFKLSKAIHPDRYFGQKLGSFATRLPAVFEALSRAYARLTSPERAAPPVDHSEQPQTPQEYAAELFDRACQLEIGGEHLEAMKLFAAAVRVDSQPRYLRRATSCALAAGQPRSALEYAKKAHSLAPADPSSARLLAAAFRSAGKLADAEEVLVMAMALKSENDMLTAELRHDLAEVRRLLAQS